MAGLTVESFNGNSLQSANYNAFLLETEEPFRRRSTAVLVDVLNKHPRYIRSQPLGGVYVVYINILTEGTNFYDRQDELSKWFARGTQGDLVLDYDGQNRRVECIVEDVRPYSEGALPWFRVVLVAPDPRMRGNAMQTDVQSVTSSPDAFTLDNDGSVVEDEALFRITPTSNKAAADDNIYVREIIVVNRAPRAMVNYMINVAYDDTGTPSDWDHDAEVTSGFSRSDGNDVRVLVDGVEVPRWAGGGGFDSTTLRLFVNMTLGAAVTAELLTAATAGSPAATEELEVEKGGADGWPSSGWLLINDEVIRYSAINRYADRDAFVVTTRGDRDTTAASHSAGDTLYWVERRVQIVYGHTAASAPVDQDRFKPLCDLTASTNALHVWEDAFLHETDPRSMQWVLTQEALDAIYDHMTARIDSVDASGAIDIMTGIYHQAPGAMQGGNILTPGNQWARDFPVRATQIVYDATSGVTNNRLMVAIIGEKETGGLALIDETHTAATAATVSLERMQRIMFYFRSFVVQHGLHDPPAAMANNASLTNGEFYYQPFDVPDAGGHLLLTELPGTTEPVLRIDEVRLSLHSNHASNTITADVSIYVEDPDSPGSYVAIVGDLSQTVMGTSFQEYVFDFKANSRAVEVKPGSRLYIGITNDGGSATDLYIERYVADKFDATSCIVFSVCSRSIGPAASVLNQNLNNIGIDGVEVTLDSDFTPYVIRGDKQDVYHLDCALANTTTGQTLSVDAYVPLNNDIEIDVKNRTVRDITDDLDMAFALTPSDPDDWLELDPGSNSMTYTEDNVVGVTVDSDWNDRYA